MITPNHVANDRVISGATTDANASATPTRAIRTLGLIGMLAGPMLLLIVLGRGFAQYEGPEGQLAQVAYIVFVIGWMCSAVGLRLLRGTGRGAGAAIVFGIQMIGLTLALGQPIQDFFGLSNETLIYSVCDIAWPLSVLFMLVVGTLAIRARVLPGLLRFAPLLCGLGLPLMFAVMPVFGPLVGQIQFGVTTAAAWMLFGYAVRRGASAR